MALLAMRDGESTEDNTMRYVRKCGYYNSAVDQALYVLRSLDRAVDRDAALARVIADLQAALDYQGDE